MDHGVVNAQRLALFQSLVVMVTDGIGETAAHSQVAGSVFVEQGVIEQDTASAPRSHPGTVIQWPPRQPGSSRSQEVSASSPLLSDVNYILH